MELWDVYDNNLNKTNMTANSVEMIENGYYHLALEIWIINSKNEILLVKKSFDYSRKYPGFWSCIGGNLCSNEPAENAIKRIVKEKLNISVSISNSDILKPIKRDPHKYAYITCFVYSDINLNDIKLINPNISTFKFVNLKVLNKMCKNGEIAYYLVERIQNIIIPSINKINSNY